MAERGFETDDALELTFWSIRKRENEEVRLALNEYRGRKYVDIRTFYFIQDRWRPSRKGVTFPPDAYPDFFKAVVQVGDTIGYSVEELAALFESQQ